VSELLLLSQLPKNQSGFIKSFTTTLEEDSESLKVRLMELGLLEGEKVTVLFEAPFGKDPIAIEVRGMVLGIGKREASMVLIERE